MIDHALLALRDQRDGMAPCVLVLIDADGADGGRPAAVPSATQWAKAHLHAPCIHFRERAASTGSPPPSAAMSAAAAALGW